MTHVAVLVFMWLVLRVLLLVLGLGSGAVATVSVAFLPTVAFAVVLCQSAVIFGSLFAVASVYEVIFEELHILLGGEDGLDLGKLFGAGSLGSLFVGILALLSLRLAGFSLGLAGLLAFFLQSVEPGLLIGGEVEAFEGVEGFGTTLGATFVGFEFFLAVVVARSLGEGCGGCYDGAKAENCYNDFLVHKIICFRL